MFKNLILYRWEFAQPVALGDLEKGLQENRFVDCGLTQEKSVGWVEPRGVAHGPLAESVGGQWILKLAIETRQVPGSVIKRKLGERLRELESSEGRKPGKREQRALQDELRFQLLPQAFTRLNHVTVWIDPQAQWLVLDVASQARADEAITCLVQSLPAISLAPLQTAISPARLMADWLLDPSSTGPFSIDKECLLQAAAGSRAVVRYTRHSLDTDEVREHISSGKQPSRLALGWRDRLTFVLTETLQLKKLGFADAVFEGGEKHGDDEFDANVAIATGELRELLPDLLAALSDEGQAPAA